jgi:hypothetical protein
MVSAPQAEVPFGVIARVNFKRTILQAFGIAFYFALI